MAGHSKLNKNKDNRKVRIPIRTIRSQPDRHDDEAWIPTVFPESRFIAEGTQKSNLVTTMSHYHNYPGESDQN